MAIGSSSPSRRPCTPRSLTRREALSYELFSDRGLEYLLRKEIYKDDLLVATEVWLVLFSAGHTEMNTLDDYTTSAVARHGI